MKSHHPKDFSFKARASSYDSGIEGKTSQRLYGLVLREIEIQPGAMVLDVGCGTGALLKKIAEAHDISGYGVDVEENMLAVATKKCPEMEFSIARCDNLPFGDQSFDVLITCMAYHHFGAKEGFAREAARVLKPDGILYIAELRLPWIVRKVINGVMRMVRVIGGCVTPEEIEAVFAGSGFSIPGTAVDGYAQVVKLQRKHEGSVAVSSETLSKA